MTFRYPLRAMVPDYARSAIGFAFAGSPLLLADLPGLVSGLLVALTAMFGLFGLQAGLRHVTRILVSERDIRALPVGACLDWGRLTRLTLAYFSTRRDGRRGWMELKLKSGRRTLRIDSRLDGFKEVVRLAVSAAGSASLPLDPATISNLTALGIGADVDPDRDVSV